MVYQNYLKALICNFLSHFWLKSVWLCYIKVYKPKFLFEFGPINPLLSLFACLLCWALFRSRWVLSYIRSNTSSFKTICSLIWGVVLQILSAQKCRLCEAPVRVMSKKVIRYLENNVACSVLRDYHQYIISCNSGTVLVVCQFFKKMPGGNEFAYPPCT